MFFCIFQANSEREPMEEMQAAEEKGTFSYVPLRPEGADGEDDFQEANDSTPKQTVQNWFHYWYHFYNVFGMTRSLTGD